MQELVEKLQLKLKQYKKMAEEAVSILYLKSFFFQFSHFLWFNTGRTG